MVNRVVTRFNIRPFSFDGFGAALKYHHINRGFRISVFRVLGFVVVDLGFTRLFSSPQI